MGEAVKAVVVPKAGEAVTEQEIIEHCRDRMAGFKKPKSVDMVDELPRNPYGKVQKTTLRNGTGKGMIEGSIDGSMSAMDDEKKRAEIERSRKDWEEKCLRPALESQPERREAFVTDTGEVIQRVYTPLDLQQAGFDFTKDLNFPGQYPFTRGSPLRCIGASHGSSAPIRASESPARATPGTRTWSLPARTRS